MKLPRLVSCGFYMVSKTKAPEGALVVSGSVIWVYAICTSSVNAADETKKAKP